MEKSEANKMKVTTNSVKEWICISCQKELYFQRNENERMVYIQSNICPENEMHVTIKESSVS